MAIISPLVIAGLILHPVSAQLFAALDGFTLGSLGTPPNWSPSCAATFNVSVSCDPRLWSFSQGTVPATTELEFICNPACLTGLDALRKMQVAQCSDTDNITAERNVYPATYVVDLLLVAYHLACQMDDEGTYCLPLWQALCNGPNSIESSSDLCSDCNIKSWQVVLKSPLRYTDEAAAKYSSLTSSCQVTAYPVGSQTPYRLGTIAMPTPTYTETRQTPTYTCESKYTIQEDDTCTSISRDKQVSTFSLLRANKLPLLCSSFPGAGTELCIPQKCNTYNVLPGDTCDRIAKKRGLTTAQIVEYNPNLNSRCGNLQLLRWQVICLSPPGVFKPRKPRSTAKLVADPCRNPGASSSCWTTPWETPLSVLPWPTATQSRPPKRGHG